MQVNIIKNSRLIRKKYWQVCLLSDRHFIPQIRSVSTNISHKQQLFYNTSTRVRLKLRLCLTNTQISTKIYRHQNFSKSAYYCQFMPRPRKIKNTMNTHFTHRWLVRYSLVKICRYIRHSGKNAFQSTIVSPH